MALALIHKGAHKKCRLFYQFFHISQRRTLLTANYACNDSWNERLQRPELKSVQLNNFLLQLQENLDRNVSVSPVDIDIFANKLHEIDTIQIGFAQHLFYKYRQTTQAPYVRDSTHHAIIRALLGFNNSDRVLEMLKDKLGYGLFLDYYTANFLMDHFIEKQQYFEAAQISYDLMLQEDMVNPLTRMLAWYSCDLHMRHTMSNIADTEASKETARLEQYQKDLEEDEVYVPINFIPPLWYDDHWDLHKDSLILGKTLLFVTNDPIEGKQQKQTILERSYQLIGAALYEKFERVEGLLQNWAEVDFDGGIAREAIDRLEAILNGIVTKEHPTEPKDMAVLTMYDKLPYITEQEKTETQDKCQKLISTLESQNKIIDCDLSETLKSRLDAMLPACEKHDIALQRKLYEKWSVERKEDLEKQEADFALTQKKLDIATRLNELQRTEEKLRYFEQEQKIKLGIKRQPRMPPPEAEAEQEQFVAAPGERSKKK